MARSFAEVRDDISQRVAGLSGWVVVDVPADLFSADVVPDAVPSAPQRTPFAVGIASSTPVDALSRQRVAGQHVLSEVTVRFLAPVKAKAKLASVDAGLDAELDLINRLVDRSGSWPVYFNTPTWVRSSRASASSGNWRTHEVVFSVVHLIDNA